MITPTAIYLELSWTALITVGAVLLLAAVGLVTLVVLGLRAVKRKRP